MAAFGAGLYESFWTKEQDSSLSFMLDAVQNGGFVFDRERCIKIMGDFRINSGDIRARLARASGLRR
jgi:hypothetical protein